MTYRSVVISGVFCLGLGLGLGLGLAREQVVPLESTARAQQVQEPVRPVNQAPAPPEDGKLRIICFGAHPDDCELKVGGTAALWAAQGHHVKLVSVTNGDIGHWREAGGPLANRRAAETRKADKILGATTEIMDVHDGELLPTLENRRTITRLIREWKADIVMSHRPNDYHPDHRYTGVLVQDAAYMVTVPFFCPDTPILTTNPAFFYYSDNFQKPNPFQADVVVNIDATIEKKLDALDVLVSQFFEGGANGSASLLPTSPKSEAARVKQVRDGFRARNAAVAKRFRAELNDWYGKEHGEPVKYAEAFEICEYGRRPDRKELIKLFPLSN
jgi:LmbE family N-acetylglucosaminyl deacetylase